MPEVDGNQSSSVELRRTLGNHITIRSKSDTGEHLRRPLKELDTEYGEEEEETPLLSSPDLLDSVEPTPTQSLAASATPSGDLLLELASSNKASSSAPSLSAPRKQGDGKLRRAATTTDGLKKKRWEIPYTDLRFNRLLGKGASGSVFLGMWGGEQVAIKKLICDASLLEADLLR